MELKTFFEHFDTLAEAPNGIQRLRELILDMAVRGSLVPQDPGDEPAKQLIQKIIEWKKRKLQERSFLKSAKLAELDNIDEPYSIPKTWKWTRIGLICGSIVPNRDKPKSFSGGYPWVTLSYFDENGIRLTNLNNSVGLSPSEVANYNARIIPKDSVLMSCVGRFGLVAVVDQDVVTNQQIHGFVIPEFLEPDYIAYLIKAQTSYLESTSTSTTVSYLNKTKCEMLPVPLPPLAEQKRIVVKVDELMALCDALEVSQQARNTLRQNLRASALDALMNAPSDSELDTAWAFVRNNWGLMCDRAEDVDGLRQAVLYFSVRGKLVKQFPQEDSAKQLLNEIKKNQLIHSRKIRKPKNLSSIDTLRKPFEIPFQWTWCRFTEVGQLERGKSKHRPRNDPSLYVNGSIPLVQTGDVARSKGLIKTYTAFYNAVGLAQSKLWGKGTLCITIAANIADSGILDFEACFPDSVVGFVPAEPIPDAKYFEFFMRTLKSSLESFAPSTAQKNINLAILDELLIPLPPLSEQKRIVAKVDELMKLCDQLEASLRQQQQKAQALAASAINYLAA